MRTIEVKSQLYNIDYLIGDNSVIIFLVDVTGKPQFKFMFSHLQFRTLIRTHRREARIEMELRRVESPLQNHEQKHSPTITMNGK